MAKPTNIEDIIAQVDQLNEEQRQKLFERLFDPLKRRFATNTAAHVRLSSLAGLGAEIWDGESGIDKYLEEERQW